MAVFTKISKSEIEFFLKDYSIGNLVSFEGIVKGTENTNYKVVTTKDNYILTLLEKRVEPEELPFFMGLQNELAANGFACPLPIKNKENSVINKLKNKNAVIISFLDGGVIFPSIDLTGPVGIFFRQSLIILTLSRISSILHK